MNINLKDNQLKWITNDINKKIGVMILLSANQIGTDKTKLELTET